jgi:NAD(P)H dehydrogenase (quinone)
VASTFDGKRTLDVTGPAAHTFNELAAFAAKLTGKPVRYQPLTAEQATAGLIGAGWWALTSLWPRAAPTSPATL